MKGYFKNMKTITKVDFATYLGVILAFIVVSVCQAQGLVNRSLGGMLVPICCYVCMSISLNLTVGILGELSLGHAGFMSVGAFSGIIAAMSLQSAVPNDLDVYKRQWQQSIIIRRDSDEVHNYLIQ